MADWLVTRNGKRMSFPARATLDEIEAAAGGKVTVEQPGGPDGGQGGGDAGAASALDIARRGRASMGPRSGPMPFTEVPPGDGGPGAAAAIELAQRQRGMRPAMPGDPDYDHKQTMGEDMQDFGDRVVANLPLIAGTAGSIMSAGAAPAAVGTGLTLARLLPAMAQVGGAFGAGSLARSALDKRPETMGEALLTAGGEAGVGALSEGVGQVGANLLQRGLRGGARAGARTILSSGAEPASDAVINTALQERVLPGLRSGEMLTDRRMAQVGDQIRAGLTEGGTRTGRPTVAGQQPVKVIARGANMPETRATRAAAEELLNRSRTTPPINESIEGAQLDANFRAQTARGQTAAGEGRRALNTAMTARADLTPFGETERAMARDALEEVQRAVGQPGRSGFPGDPALAGSVGRFRDLQPVRAAYAKAGPEARHIAADPHALPNALGASRKAYTLPRMIGPASRAAYAASNVRPGMMTALMHGADAATDGNAGLDALVRQMILQGLVPSH